jgi:hypothetical protein
LGGPRGRGPRPGPRRGAGAGDTRGDLRRSARHYLICAPARRRQPERAEAMGGPEEGRKKY